MGILDYDHVLASDAAMECVQKLLGVLYGEQDEFKKIGKMPIVVGKVKDWTEAGKVKNRDGSEPFITVRHSTEFYDELFKWWTRLRAVEVEAKLSELVAAANDVSDLCGDGCFGVWFSDSDCYDKTKRVQGSSYLVLALMCMAAGARVPAPLKEAFVAAAESEFARIKDYGAPSDSVAATLRENLVEVIRGHDFDDPAHRMFVRECFGPRELTMLAALKDRGVRDEREHGWKPWFPFHSFASVTHVPFVAAPDIPRASLSPWADAQTLYSVTQGEAPPRRTYAPPACSESSTPPRLDVAIRAIGKSPSQAAVRSMKHEKDRTCANCGKVAEKGSTFSKCARCKTRAYCDADCQKAHWSQHKKECRDISKLLPKVKSAFPHPSPSPRHK